MGHPANGEGSYGEKDAVSYLAGQLFKFVTQPRKLRTTTAMSNAQIGNSVTTGYDSELWAIADALRDTLLPKHISGDLRVAEVETIVRART